MPTRRVVTLVLAALLASTALGALAVQAMSGPAPGAPPLPTTESGALAHLAAADLRAAQWREDALLVGVRGSEGPQVDGRVDPPFAWDTSGDAFVGNGAALAWTFAYQSPELPGRTFWITLGGDGSLLYARELADPFFCCAHPVAASTTYEASSDTVAYSYPQPVRAIRPVSAEIDAPEAVATVLDRPEFREFALDHPVFLASVELGPGPENHSIWAVSYRTATFYGAFAAIDATTGEVLHVSGWPHQDGCCVDPIVTPPTPPEPCCRPEDFHRTYVGSVRAGESFDVGFPIDAASWLDRARVVVAIHDPAPDATYLLHLTDGQGRRVAEASGSDALEVTLDDAPVSGTYVATVWRQDGALTATPFWTPLPAPETVIEVGVEVLYAPEPQPRPHAYRFTGESWPGSQMVGLHVEGEQWTPMRPTLITFAYQPQRLGDVLELVLLDQHGNEVASGRGEAMTTDEQTFVLEIPDWSGDAHACCHYLEIRQQSALLGQGTTPWTLDLEVVPWAPFRHDDVGEAEPETHDGHDGHGH